MYSISGGRVAGLALAALVLTGCATMSIGSFAARNADFRQYRSYTFGAADTFSTGDPRLDNNEFFHNRVRADIAERLAARGFERRESGEPDLIVHYHASVTEELDIAATDRAYGYAEEGDDRPTVYDAGTLTIDFVDPGTKRVVWRGWAEGSLEGVVDDQAWLEERIDSAVSRILQRLPPPL
jgi:hypothetical protein